MIVYNNCRKTRKYPEIVCNRRHALITNFFKGVSSLLGGGEFLYNKTLTDQLKFLVNLLKSLILVHQ